MSDLMNEKDEVNLTDLMQEEIAKFLKENRKVIVKRVEERIKQLEEEQRNDGA